MSKNLPAKLYGVGVGPGDPELITIKAVKTLEQVDLVIAPSGSGESIAFKIARPYIRGEVLPLEFPMTRNQSVIESKWSENVKKIKGYLQKGKDIAFITLGDPMIYSTYIYLLERMAGFEVVTIPGITSYSAAAARLNMPIAWGNMPFVVTPADDNETMEKILDAFESIVLVKVSGNYDDTLSLLKVKGFKAVLVMKSGHDDEEMSFDLEKYRNKKIDYLSLIIGRKMSG
ncbi:MAG: precorrin-2 C(20)-methyltransferase [Candidatus Atribacteria bacterium]|nr:precorrin-2 C(20)-methyltransferase [Candidatus Atribacteria bacterium]